MAFIKTFIAYKRLLLSCLVLSKFTSKQNTYLVFRDNAILVNTENSLISTTIIMKWRNCKNQSLKNMHVRKTIQRNHTNKWKMNLVYMEETVVRCKSYTFITWAVASNKRATESESESKRGGRERERKRVMNKLIIFKR